MCGAREMSDWKCDWPKAQEAAFQESVTANHRGKVVSARHLG